MKIRWNMMKYMLIEQTFFDKWLVSSSYMFLQYTSVTGSLDHLIQALADGQEDARWLAQGQADEQESDRWAFVNMWGFPARHGGTQKWFIYETAMY